MTRRGHHDRGVSSVEYALVATAVAAVIVAVVVLFGGRVGDLFSNTCQTVAAQTDQADQAACD